METLTISDAAKKLKVETHVLRYWEEELGLIIKRNDLGHRYYDERDIKIFEEIQELKQKGLMLKDIKSGIERARAKNKSEVEYDERAHERQEENMGSCTSLEEWKKNREIFVGKTIGEIEKLQAEVNRMIAVALNENKDIITKSVREEITEDVVKQFDMVMREREERDEERYRRLDENIRQLQRFNEEIATTRHRKRFLKWK